jgi:predicted nucleic acid-binding protein
MALVLVSDTSVLVDLERGQVLEVALQLPYEFAVPDLLFHRELHAWDRPSLKQRITILSLDGEGVQLATKFRRADARLSLPDAFALALAKAGGHTLLSGDSALRTMADAEGVRCHGVLWVMDEIELHALATTKELHTALTSISEHRRCRLPKAEILKRLKRWSPSADSS